MINVAIEAVQAAAKITTANFGRLQEVSEKSQDREIVTKIDLEAENKIKEIITGQFPTHGFLGEESGTNHQNSEFVWLTDPIDGTVNYSRGLKKYGISLALAQGKKIVLGVVYNPITEELFTAERGKGASLNGQAIKVNNNQDLYQSVIYATEFYRSRELIVPLFDKIKNLRITSSAAYDTCMVACGRTEAFIKVTTHPWGFAAASLIVEEAGGKVTNLDGTDWNMNSTKLLATNGVLHEEIMKILN